MGVLQRDSRVNLSNRQATRCTAEFNGTYLDVVYTQPQCLKQLQAESQSPARRRITVQAIQGGMLTRPVDEAMMPLPTPENAISNYGNMDARCETYRKSHRPRPGCTAWWQTAVFSNWKYSGPGQRVKTTGRMEGHCEVFVFLAPIPTRRLIAALSVPALVLIAPTIFRRQSTMTKNANRVSRRAYV